MRCTRLSWETTVLSCCPCLSFKEGEQTSVAEFGGLLCAHPFCHRRELFSTLGSIFVWIQGLPEIHVVKLPHVIVEELWLAALQFPLATANLRAPVATKISCSDATPLSLGSVETTVSRELANALHRHSESKGKYTRLDWEGVGEGLADWHDVSLPPLVLEALRGASWKVSSAVHLKHTKHVSAQEARACRDVLCTLVSI